MRTKFGFVISIAVILTASSVKAAVFSRNLYFGIHNDQEVINLQEFLTKENIFTGPVTGNFLNLTLRAVKIFQVKEGIRPAEGYFGPKTRAVANQILLTQREAGIATAAPVLLDLTSPTSTVEEITAFSLWAQEHGITLQGIQKDINSLYYNNYNPATDNISQGEVPRTREVYRGLKLLPDSILEVMRGNTIYLSTIYERPYAVLSGSYGGVLKGLRDGIILTQPLSAQSSLHEFGHIVGYFGIEGVYNHNFPQFKIYRQEYDKLFDTSEITYNVSATTTPVGYISNYATANKAENFAEHFAYYVNDANNFRTKMISDPNLKEKYNFLKNLFGGVEY